MPLSEEDAVVTGKSAAFELLPEGVYTAEVVDMQKRENIQTKFGIKTKLFIYLAVLDEEQRGMVKVHFVNFTGLGEKSNLYKFVCTVLGEKIDPMTGINLNTLIGGRVKIFIKHYEKDGIERDGINDISKVGEKEQQLQGLSREEKEEILNRVSTKKEDTHTENVAPDEVPQ